MSNKIKFLTLSVFLKVKDSLKLQVSLANLNYGNNLIQLRNIFAAQTFHQLKSPLNPN